MEFIQKNLRAIIVALLALGVVVVISATGQNDSDTTEGTDVSLESQENSEAVTSSEESANATDDESQNTNTGSDESATTTITKVEKTDDNYTVSAVKGDNQTVLVRRIIAEHLPDDEELSAPQQLFVETNLVNKLPRNDTILVGDTIRLSEEDVSSLVSQARELTQDQLDAWSAYL